MNKRLRLVGAVPALAIGLAAFFGGCASKHEPATGPAPGGARSDVHKRALYSEPESVPATRRPAPAPVVDSRPAPAPAPQPAANCNYRPNVPAGSVATSMAIPTGEPSTSALVIHEVRPQQVRVNQPYTYEIHVTNVTRNTLNNVVVGVDHTENLSITSSTPSATMGTGGKPQWVFAEMGSCTTQVIKVTATAARTGASSDCLTATYNTALCSASQVVEPALAVSKTATAQASVCDPIAITIEVKNTGSGACENVVIRDNLPAGLTVDGKSTIESNVGTLAPGQAKQVSFTAKASGPGSYQNSATATGCGLTAQSNTTTTVVTQPVLAIEAKCSGQALINRPVACTITVRNTGNGAANNTVVTAPLPANATFVSADNGGTQSGGNIVWNLGTLAAGASKTLVLNTRSTGAGTITCSATATAVCAQQVSANCQTTVQGVPDIGTLVTDDDGVVQVGDNHTYRVEVDNQGQVNLTNVKMVCTLPAGMEFVSSPDGKFVGGKVEFNFGTLAPGSRKASTFVVRSTKSGELLVIGETTCAEIRTPIRDDELTVFIDR